MKESEQKLTNIVDFLPDATFVIDRNKRVVSWNRAIEEMTGVKREDMIGQGDYAYTVPFYGERRPHLLDLIDASDKEIESKYQYVQRKGNTLYAEVFTPALYGGKGAHIWATGAPLFDEHGNHIGAIESIRDISAQKCTSQELAWKTAFLEAQVEASIDGILVVDEKGRKILANQHLFDMWKVPQHIRDDQDDTSLLRYVTSITKSPEQFFAKVIYLYEHPKETSRDEIEFTDGMVMDRFSSPVLGKNGEYYGRIWTFRDITARKRMEEELRANERRYQRLYQEFRAILDAIPSTVLLSPELKVVWANERAAVDMNRSISDLIGKYCYQVRHARSEPCETCPVRGCFASGKSTLGESATPDGKIWELQASPIFGDQGEVKGVIEVARDISERKQAEAALKESQQQLADIINFLPGATLVIDQNGKVIAWNRAIEEMTGVMAQDMLGKGNYEYALPFYGERRSILIDLVLKPQEEIEPKYNGFRKGDNVIAGESYVPSLMGRKACLFGTASILHDSRGNIAGAIESIHDITDRRRAEEALRETQRRLTDIIDFLPDATLVIDRDGKVIAWNHAIESMTGVKAKEMLGRGNYEYALPFYGERRPILIDLALHPDPEKEKAYTALQRTGDMIIGEAYTPALAPGNVHLSATASVLRNSKGKIIAAIECIRNNTDRKKMEERLQRAEKMESLGVLAGGVAHDLNNVLGVLVGYSELLLREAPEGSRASKYARSIQQGSERAAAIIQDLLTMARRGVSVSETVNLNRIITDFFKTPEFNLIKFHHPDVLFRSQLGSDLFNIKGSPVHLFKTIMNLLSNAAESIPGMGKVSITTENRYVDVPIPGYENTREGEYVVLTVSDTGSGISPMDLERIFEPFYTKKVMGRSGTGLGLAVVWGTVKDHGGHIDVRSEENKGTDFTLYFPAVREPLSKKALDLTPDTYLGRGECILVVDDVEAQRLLAATILENLNYRVAIAASGEEAVEYLRSNKADLIILDMIMEPGIDGLETYRRILEIQPQQKAIIVSGFTKTDRVSTAQELGAGEYVKKPYGIEKIGITVRKELDRKL